MSAAKNRDVLGGVEGIRRNMEGREIINGGASGGSGVTNINAPSAWRNSLSAKSMAWYRALKQTRKTAHKSQIKWHRNEMSEGK